MNPAAHHGKLIAVVITVMVVIALAAFWYFIYRAPSPGVTATTGQGNAPVSQTVKKNDLGVQLYEQSKNPIQNKLPDTVSPVPNPIESAYKNPFQ